MLVAYRHAKAAIIIAGLEMSILASYNVLFLVNFNLANWRANVIVHMHSE